MDISLDAKITAALIGMIGIFITLIASTIAHNYQRNNESKRASREVLFYLLEIRYFILTSRINVNQLTTAYIKFFIERAKIQDIELKLETMDIPPYNEQIKEHLLKIIRHIKPKIDENLLERYDLSLQKLSADYPILAYRLKGKNMLDSVHEESQNHINRVKIFVNEETKNTSQLKNDNFFDEVITQSSNMGISVLNDDIILLAEHCGSKTTKECKNLLNAELISNYERLLQKCEPDIDKLISILKSNITQNQSTN